MKKFEIFNQFRDAVIIIDKNNEVVYKNASFCRWFKNFTDIRKFSHNMNFDICPLNSENVEIYSPLFHAVNSKENFIARVSYQSPQGKVFYYDLTALKKYKYTIIFLTDVTSKVQEDRITGKNREILEKYNRLKEENEDLLKVKQKAQSQAIRIALINKMSNIIRESMDISKILNSALNELAIMFGAYKAYYASNTCDSFIIKETYGECKKEITGTEITYEPNIYSTIKSGKILISSCLKEYENADPLPQPVNRTIIPVLHLQNLIGVVVLLSWQRNDSQDGIEILEAMSFQLGNALLRAELYQKNLNMVEELKSALKELKETQIQLINSEKMASLGQLIAGVAHEINTPIASIKSNNGILAKFIPQIQDTEIAEMLKELNEIDKEAISRISHMVTSLKKFVRLDEAELQEADINKELDLTLDLIRHETKNRIEIIKNYGTLPLIKCYPNMLNQVFTNILVNACQAISGQGQIIITTEFEDGKLTVKFKDNGKGIPAEELDKIFSAGYTTKGVGVGTGLGLAICQKIIEKHNGKISVTSEIDSGSEFIITIQSE